MNNCILNPETNRCVLKNGQIGKNVIKKYGETSENNCVYDTVTNRCKKSNNIPNQPVPITTKNSPVMQHISRIASGVKLSDTLKNVYSNNCDILNILSNNGFKIKKIESLTKNSASETVIVKITTNKGVELLAKIGYQNRNVNLDELFAENFIYKFLNKYNLPFVVEYIKQFTCPNIEKFLRQFSSTISAKLYNIYGGNEIHRGLNILLTKMCSDKCKTLADLYRIGINTKDANAILLQCMYTLVYFEEIGLQHNDLHMGNIFVEENPSNISLKFNNNRTFEFSTKYLVKIYDFDFGSIVPTKFNYKTFYPNGRISKYVGKTLCLYNKSNHGTRDTAQFLLNYSQYSNTKLLQFLVMLSLPSDLIKASNDRLLPHPGHPCKLTEKGKYKIFDNIKSAKTVMSSFPKDLVEDSESFLNPTDNDLTLIRPTLPSIALNCKEYTDMIECINPIKKGISEETKQKFNKALIKAAKSI